MTEVFTDCDENCTYAIEYRRDGRLVKRSVEVHLKRGLESSTEVQRG